MNGNDDNESFKDEEARKDLQTLTSRLYDLRERFVQYVHKINEDLNNFAGEDESTDEMSVDEEESDNNDKKTQEFLIKCIIESKTRRNEYLKHMIEYPKIMDYLVNNDPNCLQIPLRYLEPFIRQHVDKNPTGKTYDKIIKQIQDIRLNYLENIE